MRARALRRLIAPTVLAAALLVPASAQATGSWNCNGPWRVWAYCSPSSLTWTNGHSYIRAFGANGSPYRWLVYVYDNFNRVYGYGPFRQTDLAQHGVTTIVGRAVVEVYNDNEINAGAQLYNATVT